MNITLLTFGGALAAGLLSFLSPCVLPLVPAYLSYITGVSVDQFSSEKITSQRREILMSALAFVIGLALIFTILGASATVIGGFLLENQDIVSKIAGLIIIVFGLQTLGLLHIPFLEQQKRLDFSKRRAPGFLGAMLMGSAFGVGWTPCVGPFLGSILLLASQSNTVLSGMVLLFLYALGLGVPFVLAGLLIGRLMPVLSRVKRHMRVLNWASGGLLIVMGLLVMTSQMAILSGYLVRIFGTGLAQ